MSKHVEFPFKRLAEGPLRLHDVPAVALEMAAADALDDRCDTPIVSAVDADGDPLVDPVVAAAAREIRRGWDVVERVSRARWLYLAPVEALRL